MVAPGQRGKTCSCMMATSVAGGQCNGLPWLPPAGNLCRDCGDSRERGAQLPRSCARRRACLLQRRGALVNMTGDESTLSLAAPHIEAFLDSIPVVAGSAGQWTQVLTPQNEALVVPTQVGVVIDWRC